MFAGGCGVVESERVSDLLNGDLAWWSHKLGDDDGEDAIFQAGLDAVLVDADGEGEGAAERADRALGDPVSALLGWLGRDGLFSLVGDGLFRCGWGCDVNKVVGCGG